MKKNNEIFDILNTTIDNFKFEDIQNFYINKKYYLNNIFYINYYDKTIILYIYY